MPLTEMAPSLPQALDTVVARGAANQRDPGAAVLGPQRRGVDRRVVRRTTQAVQRPVGSGVAAHREEPAKRLFVMKRGGRDRHVVRAWA